jgi:hypothetical protein
MLRVEFRTSQMKFTTLCLLFATFNLTSGGQSSVSTTTMPIDHRTACPLSKTNISSNMYFFLSRGRFCVVDHQVTESSILKDAHWFV